MVLDTLLVEAIEGMGIGILPILQDEVLDNLKIEKLERNGRSSAAELARKVVDIKSRAFTDGRNGFFRGMAGRLYGALRSISSGNKPENVIVSAYSGDNGNDGCELHIAVVYPWGEKTGTFHLWQSRKDWLSLDVCYLNAVMGYKTELRVH
ncbi:hypothetical protein HYY70_00800 [Candidatus Woesearchaeota archaeon]|nr:hypothetical protein [Candidatus Woesearchaeota archaeon]